MEAIPVLLFLLNGILYLMYTLHVYYDTPFLSKNIYWGIKHFCETSFIGLVVLFYLSIRDRWSVVPKICIVSLTLLWINNISTIVFDAEPTSYFFIFASIIYITSVILSIWALTRR